MTAALSLVRCSTAGCITEVKESVAAAVGCRAFAGGGSDVFHLCMCVFFKLFNHIEYNSSQCIVMKAYKVPITIFEMRCEYQTAALQPVTRKPREMPSKQTSVCRYLYG